MRPLNLQNHAKHASCFVVITSVLPHSITNVFTRTRKGSYRFFQLNPQTILKKQLNGLAHNCAVFLFLSLVVVSQLFSSCLETFFNFFFASRSTAVWDVWLMGGNERAGFHWQTEMYTKVFTLIIAINFSSVCRLTEILKEAKVSCLCSSIRQAFTARFIHFPSKLGSIPTLWWSPMY